MLSKKRSGRQHIKISLLTTVGVLCLALTLLVAKTLTRPLDVTVRTHIKICQKTEKSGWRVIDEVGPKDLRFRASLLQLAKDHGLKTNFHFRTKTKKGRDYSVRLLNAAKVRFNPATGKTQGDLFFEITLGDKKARVPAVLTTESIRGPLGNLKGRRARGILGRDRTSMKLVSVNKFQPDAKTDPLMLVCVEEYELAPRD